MTILRKRAVAALGGLGLGLSLALAAPRAEADVPRAPEPATRTTADASLAEHAVIAHWLATSPEVASWRARLGAARFDVVTARVWPNPEVGLAANVLVAGAPPDGLTGYAVDLAVPLPIFGQVGARVDAANARVSVAEATVAVALWERAGQIELAMVDRAFAEARAERVASDLAELERLRGVVASRTSAGASGPYDVLRVDTAVGTLRASFNDARVARERADARLLALVADPSGRPLPVRPEGLKAFRGPEDETALVRGALARRPDLELARRGVRAADTEASRLRREAVPTPQLKGGALLVQGPYGLQVTGGVSLPLPLFDRNQGGIGRALGEADAAQHLTKALEARVRAEVAGAFRARALARDALEDFRRTSVAPAGELLRRAETTYQAGAFSIAELLDAHQTLWAARAQEVELDRQRADAEAEVERAAVLGALPLKAQPLPPPPR